MRTVRLRETQKEFDLHYCPSCRTEYWTARARGLLDEANRLHEVRHGFLKKEAMYVSPEYQPIPLEEESVVFRLERPEFALSTRGTTRLPHTAQVPPHMVDPATAEKEKAQVARRRRMLEYREEKKRITRDNRNARRREARRKQALAEGEHKR